MTPLAAADAHTFHFLGLKTHMGLQSLVFCSDEKIVRVLRRVLSDLEISIDQCRDSNSAIHKLTRQRFEAVIVDCTDEQAAAQVLKSARSAPCNKRAVAVAIIDGTTALRSAFDLGAHFVLYKPLSAERAKASFRAARALMKRERRRNMRVPAEIPVTLLVNDGAGQQRAITSDLGEGGMAIQSSQRPKNQGNITVQFTLPGTEHSIECMGQIAWESAGRQSGIRFLDLAPETRDQLKAWINSHSAEAEPDDPPVGCKLTDLSLGGCYLEIIAPFPVRTRIVLSMRVGDVQVQAEGVVRVMHPEVGMGVEFTQKTTQQREHVQKFIQALTESNGILPELLVEPEGLDAGESVLTPPASDDLDDPLLDLFRRKVQLTTEAFLIELRRQRGPGSEAQGRTVCT
jgi:DNA-binding response OmpR family regulator